ncbi:MAG: hypothetical protein MI864_13115, partial [Pseudomonadales bacterium]|nr:hypothetical protein [Pseudomonadales bacterium]
MPLSKKVNLGLAAFIGVIFISAAIGFYSTVSLSKLLEFITTTAWDTADGSMEGSIGIEAQMLAVERITSGRTAGAQALLEEGESLADEALGRMMNAGLMSRAEIDQ